MKKYKYTFLLLIVFLTAFFFRFWKLGETPSGFYLDEASIGYNAYSILKTGKDEFGKQFPILLRSFTVFGAPVYSYLLIPIYAFFEPTTFNTRIISAISSIITILFAYLLIKKLSKSKSLSIIFALLFATSPWHIVFSRSTYETSLALCFLMVSIYFFYKSLDQKSYLVLSAILASFSVLSYPAQRIITPLTFILLAYINKTKLFKKSNIKIILISVVTTLILLSPLLSLINTPGFNSRLSALSIFSIDLTSSWGYREYSNNYINTILNNRLLLHSKEFLSLYSTYFSPRYIFNIGDAGPRSSYPNLPPLFVWQLPFWFAGILKFRKQFLKNKPLSFLILTLLVISPIPASVTRDPFSSIRSLPILIPHLILISYGIKLFINKYKRISIVLISALYIISSLKLYYSVFLLNDYFRYQSWNHGTSELVKELLKHPSTPVILDNSREEIYSQILFFSKTDPFRYQKNNYEVSQKEYYTNIKRNLVKQIDNITIRGIDWQKDIFNNQIIAGDYLSISREQITEHCLIVLSEIYGPDGKLIYIITQTNPKSKLQYGIDINNKIIPKDSPCQIYPDIEKQ